MKYLEKYIKKEIPYDKNLLQYDLGPLGKSIILYEKAFWTWIRADVSIFTQNKGLICIEIKNAHDTLKRLPKELKGYRLIANYVYVYTAPNHLQGVKKIVKDLHMESFVGIIEYSMFDGVVIPGLVKSAKPNNHFCITALLWIMWYPELLRLLLANYGQSTYQCSHMGMSFEQIRKGMKSFFTRKHPSKRQVINKLLSTFSNKKCLQLVCDMFIYNDCEPQKPLNKSLFKEVKDE